MGYYNLGIEFATVEYLAMEAGVTVGLSPRRSNLKTEARRRGNQRASATPSEFPTSPLPQNDREPVPDQLPVNQQPSRTKKAPIKRRKSSRGPEVQREISLTIGQVGADVDIAIFDKLAVFLKREASMIADMY
ncbi:hypothetical protein R1sor_018341 [Riccia sorocarpa]|uniref:Uncharacterized protein n=1 Tax=Riccia sorocarpa TaxID=122646 RepID=A0ABD3ICP9_9MARC